MPTPAARKAPARKVARPSRAAPKSRPRKARPTWVDVAVVSAMTLAGMLALWYFLGPRPTAQPAAAPSLVAQTPSPSPAATPAPSPSPTSSSSTFPVIAAPQAHPHLQAGRQLVLRSDVLFSLGSATLTDSSRITLVRLAQSIAAAHLKGTIQINGYTDNTGTAASNAALSLARALAVARVLQAPLAGQAVTLVPQGFGETSPVATNSNAEGQASNRRVTIVLPKA